MAKEPIDMKKNLQNIWIDMHFLQDIACSKEENKQFRQLKKNGEALPDGIREYQDVNGVVTGEFFRIYDAGLTENERLEYTFYGMLQQLRTIKKCCVFFTTLTVISLIIGFLLWHCRPRRPFIPSLRWRILPCPVCRRGSGSRPCGIPHRRCNPLPRPEPSSRRPA